MSELPKYYVYALETKNDGHLFYLGKGSGRRYLIHSSRAKRSRYSSTYVYRKINKLWRDGDDFTSRIIFRTDDEQEAFFKEKELIAIIGLENLCNIATGGEGSSRNDEDTKKKTGEEKKIRKHTPETIELMRKVHTGQTLSPEEWKRQNDLIWANPERLEHLRTQAAKCRKQVRRVDTGEIFDSVKDAAYSINMAANSLCRALKDKRPCNGVLFEYAF